MRFKKGSLILWLYTFILIVLSTRYSEAQQNNSPLLLPGKQTLYQRVLTRPDAVLLSQPSNTTSTPQSVLDPFTSFYVYDRKTEAGSDWLEVGQSTERPTDGWILAEKVIDWKQTLTVSFTNPANRDPALFFEKKDLLLDLLETDSLAATAQQFREKIQMGQLGQDFPIVALEPSTYIDLSQNFYLLPILDFDEGFFNSGFSTRVLNIAAVPLNSSNSTLTTQPKIGKWKNAEASEKLLTDFETGIVFVIDTTISMGKYIDRTREAVRQIYQRLSTSEAGGKLRFGLVGYRSSTSAVPQLEYVSRVFANFQEGAEESIFFQKMDRMQPATVSSSKFSEDAYAGILSAIQDIHWENVDGRYVILITDAGALSPNDSLSSTKRGAEQLRILAHENGIALYALHLLTPEGKNNHASAQAQYGDLTLWNGIGSMYYPVKEGAVAEFGDTVDRLTMQLLNQLELSARGQLIDSPMPSDSSDRSDSMTKNTAIVGRAMQLAYLGRKSGEQAPSLINAWVADRDFGNPALKTMDVRVLITRNQLSDLQTIMRTVLEAGEKTRITPSDFFDQLQSAAATLSRNPYNLGKADNRKLADVGLMAEYLDGLPYKSKIMELTEEDWLSWSFGQQREFLDEIESKILLYTDYHDDVSLWVSLDGGRVPGDAVYPIQLDALP